MIRESLEQSVRDALAAVGVEPPASVQLERPARREHGDWSSNVALVSAKQAGRPPRELATALVEQLTAVPPAHDLRDLEVVDRVGTLLRVIS